MASDYGLVNSGIIQLQRDILSGTIKGDQAIALALLQVADGIVFYAETMAQK